jgi:hypothetical protein
MLSSRRQDTFCLEVFYVILYVFVHTPVWFLFAIRRMFVVFADLIFSRAVSGPILIPRCCPCVEPGGLSPVTVFSPF